MPVRHDCQGEGDRGVHVKKLGGRLAGGRQRETVVSSSVSVSWWSRDRKETTVQLSVAGRAAIVQAWVSVLEAALAAVPETALFSDLGAVVEGAVRQAAAASFTVILAERGT